MASIYTVYSNFTNTAVKSFFDQLEAEEFLAARNDSQGNGLRILQSELIDNKPTLERYFRANYNQSVEYWVRLSILGDVYFNIKSLHIDGENLRFKVTGNGLEVSDNA